MKILSLQSTRKNNSLFLGVCFLWIFTVSAAAATYQVTNTADSGAGSLRQAVADANGTFADDTINFNIPTTDPNCDSGGVCTITLTGGVILIQAASGTLNVANQTGAGKLLISGNNVNRIFEVLSNANLTIDGVTVTRGLGNSNQGVVTNVAGTLTIKNSVFKQNGGRYIIFSLTSQTGVLNIINTTVADNTGIGIFVTNGGGAGTGTAHISNSTVSNNVGTGSGDGNGGGIYFRGNQMTITNSTVSGNSNSYAGGIFAADANITLTNCTITGNRASDGGGGIGNYRSTVKLRNTIVSGNTSNIGTPDFNFQFGMAMSLGNNLIGNSTNTGSPGGIWLPSDFLNQAARLAPLGNYGGATQTHALLPDSAAINTGSNCVLTANGCGGNNPAVPTDQRGAVRVRDVDIGAFEFATQAAFDFDGDGRSDISVFRPSNGFWYRLNSQNNSFAAAQFGRAGDKLAPADYDGDGKTDIAVFREGVLGYFYILNSADNTFRFEQFGTMGDAPVSGDWDGDGRGDLAVYRGGTAGTQSNFYYRPTAAPNVDFRAVVWGTNGDKPIVGDFDGDGKLDAAVFRPSNGVWYVLKSSDNQLQFAQFGTTADIPTAADFDGDGKTNYAVFRPATGTWFTSQNPATNFGAIQFGANGDSPVPADYDGDGKADVAVFRNGTWYLNRSQAGFTGVAFGSAGDRPVPNALVP